MDTNIKISIGMNDNVDAGPNSYTRVHFDFQLQAQRINALTKQLQEKTGKFRVPTIIFDFPQSAKQINLKFFQSEQNAVNYEVIQKNGRVYKCLDIFHHQFTSMKKRVQKVFSSLNNLDNKLYLHLDLYNIDQFQKKLKQKVYYAAVVFLQKAKIQGRFSLDPKFFDVLTQSIAAISPKFAQSPIMAVIPMFGGLDCQLQIDSLYQLQQANQKQLFNSFSYEDPGDDQQGLQKKEQFKNKQKVYIYLSFGTMAILKIELQVRMFAIYNCIQ